MGLLTQGKPLTWEESQKFLEFVKKHGIEQFISTWNKYKFRCCDSFKWGDEIEYLLVYTPKNNRIVRLSLRSKQIQDDANKELKEIDNTLAINEKVIIHPEYGSFMIEATPKIPYDNTGCDLLNVEPNMSARRHWIEKHLSKNEKLVTLAAFPTLGVGKHVFPHSEPNGKYARSQFVSDAVINPHPRFGTLTQNIRKRRGKKVDIRIPIFRDKFTPKNEKEIYMDAMAFGMGCCCLQVTFQAREVDEARHLYDQLAVLGPPMMALTAATPILRGKLSNLDCRWTVIAQSVDDRTDAELGKRKLKLDEQLISKSRYDTISCFISRADWLLDEYNDINLEIDEWSYKRLKEENIDDRMCKHLAHLWVRDPLVVYSDLIDMDDKHSSHHFDTIQSTNWQNVRFKPPPIDQKYPNDKNKQIGWRVEFRTMEVQITDFENAAFSIFVTLVSRAILAFGLNLYIPISKIDENTKRSHAFNAIQNCKFYWRVCRSRHRELRMEELTIKEIFCGGKCKGLIEIVNDYLDEIKIENSIRKQLDIYLLFIKKRASGELLTTAQWLRKFVINHPMYKFDSNVNEFICRDIIDTVDKICKGKVKAPALLGDFEIKSKFRQGCNINNNHNGHNNNRHKSTLVSRL